MSVFWIAGPVQARQAEQLLRRHRYTEAILSVKGTQKSLDERDDRALSVLGVAHLQRAYFLRDLAALQVAIGEKYYSLRLTSDEVTPTPWTAYFLGRYLFEQGLPEHALPHFEASFDAPHFPLEYRRRARLWAAACLTLQGRIPQATALWDAVSVDGNAALAGERAIARWKTGVEETPRCNTGTEPSVAAYRCRLWAALQARNIAALSPLQDDLIRRAAPDREVVVHDDFVLQFYDPATLELLVLADFAAAMDVFRRIEGTSGRQEALLYAGISAYEAGYYTEAHAFLEQTSHPLRVVYLGALRYQEGKRAAARALWTEARSGDPTMLIEWAFVASRFEDEHDAIRQAAGTHATAKQQTQRTARKLGRALLNVGQIHEALHLLEAVYPIHDHNRVDTVEPGYMTTLTQAKFLTGRPYYPAVRSHLVSLVDVFPVAEGVLYLAQAYTAPERTTGKKRTGQ
ncbi:MAG: hypothetical protein ACE5G0_18740 [Rhodothermales bacterium]